VALDILDIQKLEKEKSKYLLITYSGIYTATIEMKADTFEA
jgi:hypothetical protein